MGRRLRPWTPSSGSTFEVRSRLQLRATAALPDGGYMRLLRAFALPIAVAALSVSAALAAPTADRDVARTTRAGLIQLHSAIAEMNACRGCPAQSGKVQAVSQRWRNQLYQVSSSTDRGRSGLHAAIEAFRNYGNAANSAALSYAEYHIHPGVSAHYDIYVRQYRQAQAYAKQAVRSLRINVPIIP